MVNCTNVKSTSVQTEFQQSDCPSIALKIELLEISISVIVTFILEVTAFANGLPSDHLVILIFVRSREGVVKYSRAKEKLNMNTSIKAASIASFSPSDIKL